MSLSASPASIASLMVDGSSGPSTEQLRTISDGLSISSDSASELSDLSDEQALRLGTELLVNGKDSDVQLKYLKRPRELDAQTAKSQAKRPKSDANGDQLPKGIYCHQCRHRKEIDEVLRCTRLKQFSKNTQARACNLAFCDVDLKRRYQIDAPATRQLGRSGHNLDELLKHDSGSAYIFSCPCCRDICQTSSCRKKKGLNPMGNVTTKGAAPSSSTIKTVPKPTKSPVKPFAPVSLPQSAGTQPPTPAATPASRAAQPKPADSSAFDILSGSELSSLSDAETSKKARMNGSTSKKAVSVKGSAKKDESRKDAKRTAEDGKKALKAEDVGSNGKGKGVKKAKAVKPDGKVSAKPKADQKPEVVVEPPAFEKVDTRLGRAEIEYRIMLREYAFRFRATLAIPERMLMPLDDFDRSLTEASVRLLAGSMLELVKHEVEVLDDEEELADTIFKYREELRYYADLARFATIYNALAEPLRLRLPSAVMALPQRTALDHRTLLDLGGSDDAPQWLLQETGPLRRSGASRLPHSTEVVRMLLALAERTLATQSIRADLDSTSGEGEERRRHANATKAATNAWEAKKKQLGEARVRCKSAAETKTNKQEYAKQLHEHDMRIALLDVNLRAQQARRAPRHEALGVDLDGRIYYVLAPRAIEDDGRPPIGWASGLLVWGIGVTSKTKSEVEDELPVDVERWFHFGKSRAVRQLIKWIEWRLKKALSAMKSAKTPVKTNSAPNTPAESSPSKITAYLKPTPKKDAKGKSRFEVVMPSRRVGQLDAIEADDSSSTSSGLSPPPVPLAEQIQQSLAPTGYSPSAITVEEEGKELVRRLKEVAEWLEVLEWKGMGEVH